MTERVVWEEIPIDLKINKVFDPIEGEFEILERDCLDRFLRFHYHLDDYEQPILLLIKVRLIECATIKDRHLKRQTYLEPISQGVTQALWKINSLLINKTIEGTNKNTPLLDMTLFHIKAGRFPITKVTQFKDLIICYDRIEEVTYRGKKRNCLFAKIIDGQILLHHDYKYVSDNSE